MTAVIAAAGAHDSAASFVAFGIFVVLAVVLAFFVVRFAIKLNRDRPGSQRRPGR